MNKSKTDTSGELESPISQELLLSIVVIQYSCFDSVRTFNGIWMHFYCICIIT